MGGKGTEAVVRAAAEADLPAIAAIHNRAILQTALTWHWDPIDLPARRQWLAWQAEHDFPVLVAEVEGDYGKKVAGFASYGPFRPFAGYKDTVEHSVYLDEAFQGFGLGGKLMAELLRIAKARGVHVMVAAISIPNEASVALHASMGFAEVGRMPEVGLKFGLRRDLLLMQRVV